MAKQKNNKAQQTPDTKGKSEYQDTKAVKTLGKDTVDELNKLDASQLKDKIVQANTSMKLAKDELEMNAKYQELKSALKALNGGHSDLKKRQNGIIRYCLARLEEKGQ